METNKVKNWFLKPLLTKFDLYRYVLAHAALIPHVRLPWLPNGPELPPYSDPKQTTESLSLPRPLWEPVAVAAAAAAAAAAKNSLIAKVAEDEEGARVPSPVVDVGQGCLLAKDKTLPETGTPGGAVYAECS
jgi:hypothetical protein